jgi:iron complex transport system permease protein
MRDHAPTGPTAPPGPARRVASRDKGPWVSLGVLLGALTLLLAFATLQVGSGVGVTFSAARVLQGLGAALGVGAPLDGALQALFEQRVADTTAVALVGAALALSGGLLQGVFRNDLASPGLLGISSGATLGAVLGVIVVGGGLGGAEALGHGGVLGPALVSILAFVGALVVAVLVVLLGTSGGRISVPTLLLLGVAANACLGGALAALQEWLYEADYELSRAVFSWTFGNLADRTAEQVTTLLILVPLAVLSVPFVARELDLLAGGEEDAEALGVDTRRAKVLAVGAASLAAAAAVAVAGQIAFVGLVVPHILRSVFGHAHPRLLPGCVLGGAAFLLGADLLNHVLLGERALRPGVMLSLIGGPFFLALVLRRRAEVRTW